MDKQTIWDKLTEINDWLNEHDNDISESNHSVFYCIKESGSNEWRGVSIGTPRDFVIIAYQALLKAYAGISEANVGKSFAEFLIDCTHMMNDTYRHEDEE